MSGAPLHNLASPFFVAQDADDVIKIIIFVIGGIIWLAYNVMGALGKQQEKRRRESLQQTLGQQQRREPPLPAPMHPRAPAMRPTKKPARPSRRAVPTTFADQLQTPVETLATFAQTRSAVPTSSRSRTRAISGSSLRQWLTPTTLRRQFILTEVLQAPIALRPNHLDRAP